MLFSKKHPKTAVFRVKDKLRMALSIGNAKRKLLSNFEYKSKLIIALRLPKRLKPPKQRRKKLQRKNKTPLSLNQPPFFYIASLRPLFYRQKTHRKHQKMSNCHLSPNSTKKSFYTLLLTVFVTNEVICYGYSTNT